MKAAALVSGPRTCSCFSNMKLPARRFFAAEGCKLRVGAYTSLNTLCTYLESDVSADGQAERNFWVSTCLRDVLMRLEYPAILVVKSHPCNP